MGGKKNQTQRTKNNAKPSSSGRSADLLGVAKPFNPFLSFSLQKDATDSSLQDAIDPTFQVVLKKMSKKDSTTKLKALQEFTNLCTDEDTETETILPVLSFWCRQYTQLVIDIEHKVRELAHVSHQAVVKRCKRNLAPYLRQIAGPWFVSQCDTHAPAASAATKSFTDAFPPNKLLEAILFCQAEIIKYISDNLVIQTADTLSNPTATAEEKEMKYQRVLISCLHGYALYLSRIPTDQLIEEANKDLVSSKAFWKHAKDSSPVVRSAWYTALIALCQYSKVWLEDQLPNLSKVTIGNLNETEAIVAPLVWEATLHAVVALPDLWKCISIEKVLAPKLLHVCRNAGYGCAFSTFPSLLPLITQIPAEMIKKPETFYDELLSALEEGLTRRSVQQSNSENRVIVATMMECLQFSVTNLQSNKEFCLSLYQRHLLPMLLSVENASREIALLLKSWSQAEEKSIQRELFHRACDDLTKDFSRVINDCKAERLLAKNADERNARRLLRQQLCIVTNLLKGEKFVAELRSRKVNFASSDEAEKESPSEKPIDSAGTLYESAILNLAARVCFSYLRVAGDLPDPEFVRATLKLVLESGASEIIPRLVHILEYSDSAELFTKLLVKWMHSSSGKLRCKETVSLGLQIVFLLPPQEQRGLLDVVFSPPDDNTVKSELLIFLVEELTTPEAKEKLHVRWTYNPALKNMLIQLTNYVVLTDEETETAKSTWILLERVAALCVEEGHKDTEDLLNGILQVFEEHLRTDVGTETHWLVPATRVLHYVYNARGLSLLSLPSDHEVIQSIFQVYLESVKEDSEISELFQFSSEALCALHEFSGTDSPLFRNTLAAFNERLQDFVISEESSQTKRIVTLASRIVTMLRPIVGEDAILHVLRKLCGPPPVPGSASGPLSGSLSEDWARLNALVLNGEVITCGGTHRGEADVLATQYSPCLAEGIPMLDINGCQLELVKPLLWFLLSVVTLVDTLDSFEKKDSLPSSERALICDTYGALAVATQFTQLFPSTELTPSVDNVKAVCDQHLARFTVSLTELKRKQIQELLLERAAVNLKDGGRYWVRALEIWVEAEGNELSEEEAGELLEAPEEYWTTILQPRSELVDVTTLPNPAIKFDGSLESLNLGQYAGLEMYLLTTRTPTKEVVHSGFTALGCINRLGVERLLFDCDIFECRTKQVRDVVRINLFLRTVLAKCPALLSEAHWDLILVSVASWISSFQRTLSHASTSEDGRPVVERLTATMVCSFVSATCNLYTALQKVLSDIRNQVVILPEEIQKETFVDAWPDVFAEGCDKSFAKLWLELAENASEAKEMSPMASVILDNFSEAFSSISLSYLGQTMSKEIEEIRERLLLLLSSPIPSVRLASYCGLKQLVCIMVKKDAEILTSFEFKASEGQFENLVIHAIGVHVESFQNRLESTFSGVRVGESRTLEPFTESYNVTCGYLLLWMIILDMYSSANRDVRFQYAHFLKSRNFVQNLLHNTFRLLPQSILRQPDLKNKITTDYFTKKCSFKFLEKWTSERLCQMACHVFLTVLTRLSAITRSWWGELDSSGSTIINNVITEHCSALVSAVEMKEVLRHQGKAVENMSVKVHMSTREVVATYTVDELTMELIVKLPNNYPLAPMTVEVGKGNVGGSNQWRSWLMQISMYLTHQYGSLWDGLALWRDCVVRRYEGVEECYICFCVLHGVTYQLPKLSCRTCRKKFHSPCLYKWFQTSNKSTCPICRNLF